MEFNKAFAAVLLAGIIGMVSGLVADALIVPEEVAENTYHIDTSAIASPEATSAEDSGLPPVSPLLAEADPVAGQQVASTCVACHTFEEGGANKVGPNNWDIVGAPMGHRDDFNYSAAMREKHAEGAVWGYEELNAFLAGPRSYIPGTTMSFAGVRSPQDRANLIAWLRTLSSDPVPLPDPAEAEAAGEAQDVVAPSGDEPAGADDTTPPAAGPSEAPGVDPVGEEALGG